MPEAVKGLRHPVWLQILALNRFLRQKEFIKELAAKVGEVLIVDEVESYRKETVGPRV